MSRSWPRRAAGRALWSPFRRKRVPAPIPPLACWSNETSHPRPPRSSSVKSLLRGRRPSPALIVASIALFVSLSGVSYGVATGFIDSREIKNNEIRSIDLRNNQIRTRDLRNNEVRGIDIRNSTVQGRDIALNTVTGEDVKEDTLQKVPSALLADRATAADSVGGMTPHRIAYSAAEGSPKQTILSMGGLTLT